MMRDIAEGAPMPVESLVLQLSYALLIGAALAPSLRAVRLLIALAALVGLGRALLWTGDLVTAVWMGLLLAACLYLLGRHVYESRRVRFTPDEKRMFALVSGLSQSRARHLIDQGMWLTGKEGDVLTREGEPVGHLYFLAEGEAKVMSTGRQVGVCRSGDLIGELTVLSGETASATVILTSAARFWCAAADDLRPYVEAHDDIRRAIEHGFATALKAKLRASNRAIAESGGVAPAA